MTGIIIAALIAVYLGTRRVSPPATPLPGHCVILQPGELVLPMRYFKSAEGNSR